MTHSSSPLHADRILVLDFGSQVTQLIARRLRESGVYCEIMPYSVNPKRITEFGAKGIILSGGPRSVTERGAPCIPSLVFDLDLPILGICYGQQAMCKHLGGMVESSDHREFGRAYLSVTEESPLFDGVWAKGDNEQVWMSHGDRVTKLPDGFEVTAISGGAPYAIIANEEKKYYGLQFHPEVVHTPDGAALLKNFTHKICGCAGAWTMAAFKDQAKEKILTQVGADKVICGLSGGVDSSVTAVLIDQAIGNQLHCIFVDHGLLRYKEREQVETMFRDHYNMQLTVVDAADEFLGKLEGVTDPEQKRKIIGASFIDVFEREAAKIGGADFLAQGTLYPDVIESVSFTGGPSVTIKSHHNVGGLPERMKMDLVEPLRELFKDEVRVLGRELGLPEKFIRRHPFPGPGLAIRMPGEVTAEKCDILRQVDRVYLEEIESEGLYDAIWQAFAVLLPVKTVGVMGDGRTYDHVCALRAVTAVDGMTADVFPFSPEFLGRCATRIINEVRGINRVVYDVTSKPPGTIEWE